MQKNKEMTTYEYYVRDVDEHIRYKRRRTHKVCAKNNQEMSRILSECRSVTVLNEKCDIRIEYSNKENDVVIRCDTRKNSEWKDFLFKCNKIKILCIDSCNNIPKEIFEIKSIKHLELRNCNVKKHMSQICYMDWLECLVLDDSNIDVIPKRIEKLKRLEVLTLMHTKVTELPDTILNLKNLQYLGLNGLNIEEVPLVVTKMTNLKSLYMGLTKIKRLPDAMSDLKKLEHLAIWETELQELPDWVCTLQQLEGLYLGRTKGIKKLPCQIGKLKNLKYLYLDGTGLSELPGSFGKLINLRKLTLAHTHIHKFPRMEKLPNLVSCDLSGMIIERIPKEFIYSNMDINVNRVISSEGLNLYGTKLLCQPISLFTHDKEFIYAYYEEEKIHLNETKIVFLGDGEAGKSHIIQRIKNNGENIAEFREEATPGIAISQKECVVDSERINLQIWDFGGQEIMHSMHRFFLTERTLYVIVINARDNTQDDRAKYWLNNIKSFANGCPVILVLNKMDQNPSASINERLLRNDYPQIVDTIKMSALNDNKDVFSRLESTILTVVKTFDSYAMDFPVSWNKVKATLTEMKDNYIIDENYRDICRINSVDDEQIQNWLLDWFHDLGVSFNYRKRDLLLGGYMILKPNWITNAIYIILFNGISMAQNGIISIEAIVNLLSSPPKSVEMIKYNILEVPYILGVMRRFEISYSIDNEYEFIPMMCNRNQHKEAEDFINNDSMEYYMEYEYLPNNVLHKLMIKMQKDIDKNKIWLTGMITESREGHVSALIRMHNNSIEIFVKSIDEEFYPSREYIAEIREILISINQEINLEAEDMIVYKENGISEKIKYSILLAYLGSGQKEYFSVRFRKLISIKKILGLVEKEEDVESIIEYCNNNRDVTYSMLCEYRRSYLSNLAKYEKFEMELLECCTKLQGNTLQIQKGKENDRNTYLRDLLSRNKNYQVYDQTLNGMSANKKNAGELDLLIRDNRMHPFSIVEALTLKVINKKYLGDHINKLYDYDTWGLPYNYIVVYAETDNFVSFYKRYKQFIQKFAYPFPLQDVRERTSKYTELCIFDTILLRNEKQTVITHIIVHLMK